MKIFVLYENNEWFQLLAEALSRHAVPYEGWFVDQGAVNPAEVPPAGLFLNRLSASASTRDHAFSLRYGEQLIAWLEAHGRRVINGSAAIRLEQSKFLQHQLLQKFGIRTPESVFVTGGLAALQNAAKNLHTPFVYKYNCGGKGLGVQLIRDEADWQQFCTSSSWQESPDGVHVLQRYVAAKDPFITRCEFIAGRFHYAIKADTSQGFELCPAQGCEGGQCTLDEVPGQSLFSLRTDFQHPILTRYAEMLQGAGVDIAGIEFLEDEAGDLWTYDINCNTNYSPRVEQGHAVQPGLDVLADWLRQLCEREAQR
jgi:hypothetical protein